LSTVIEEVKARKVFNSRGDETIEIEVYTTKGFGRVAAPSGKSKGKHEVAYYPAGGIEEAIKKVEKDIAHRLVGMNADEQEEIDSLLHEIDGTENFQNIGGNTAYAVSIATAEAAASSYHMPLFRYLGGYSANKLPYPLGNVMSGGAHTYGATPEIQEFLCIPIGATSFSEAAMANIMIHKKTDLLLRKKNLKFVGGHSDEGAWIANIANEEALEIIDKAKNEVAEELGFECKIGVDIAASSFWDPAKKCYVYSHGDHRKTPEEQYEFVLEIIEKYKLAYIEDPFHEEDFDNYSLLTRKVKKCLVCGDDIFTTNIKRLEKGIKLGAANSIIIKVNQVGTLTDALAAINMAKASGFVPIISHRSGDTIDSHIAHLAVGFQCPIIKTGIVEGARIAKINELLRIEETLGNKAQMPSLHL
jgi:enolase